jgi:hypothetical protein
MKLRAAFHFALLFTLYNAITWLIFNAFIIKKQNSIKSSQACLGCTCYVIRRTAKNKWELPWKLKLMDLARFTTFSVGGERKTGQRSDGLPHGTGAAMVKAVRPVPPLCVFQRSELRVLAICVTPQAIDGLKVSYCELSIIITLGVRAVMFLHRYFLGWFTRYVSFVLHTMSCSMKIY